MSRLIAVLSILALAVFLGILIWRVPHPDLIAVLAICFGLAAFDILTSAWRSRRKGNGDRPA